MANESTTLVPPSEVVDFGNEVDFFGDPVLALKEVGFHVFQTGENASPARGGPTNMPNIKFEIDPNTAGDTNNYATMVFVPNGVASTSINRWSGYIDATDPANGYWYFTGADHPGTVCNQGTMCSFDTAMAVLDDVTPEDPIFYTVAVGKGRDNLWAGAVDGLRLNSKVYDFEFTGVKVRNVNQRGGGDDDD